jgi:hypothetical protein
MKKRFNSYCNRKAIRNFKAIQKNRWCYLSNNYRRMHGLPLMRNKWICYAECKFFDVPFPEEFF